MGLVVAAVVVTAWFASLALGLVVEIGFGTPAQMASLVGVLAVRTFLYAGLFITAHDAMHGVVAPGHRTVNDATGRLCLALYAWLGWERMRDGHMKHHQHPTAATDPDASADPRYFPWLFAFFRSYIDAPVIVRNGLTVTALYLCGVSILDIAVVFVLPAWLSILQLFTFGTWAPHRPRAGRDVDEHRAVSSDVSPLVSFFACYHFGYHWEHHAFPHVPWWGLPAARRLVTSHSIGA